MADDVQSEYEQPKSNRVVKYLMIGCSLLIVVGIGAGIGLYFLAKKGLGEAIRAQVEQYEGLAEEVAEAREIDPQVAQVKQMAEDGEIAFITAGILVNRLTDIMADEKVEAEEVGRFGELLDDIIATDGSVNINDYPAGR